MMKKPPSQGAKEAGRFTTGPFSATLTPQNRTFLPVGRIRPDDFSLIWPDSEAEIRADRVAGIFLRLAGVV